MTGEASQERDELTALPHYHVIAENDDEVICSDAFTWPCAQAFAADLISPPGGAPVYEPVKAIWIIEGGPSWCPLAHGDGIPADDEAAAGFLQEALQRQPYWSI
jgi:hypothetical protein